MATSSPDRGRACPELLSGLRPRREYLCPILAAAPRERRAGTPVAGRQARHAGLLDHPEGRPGIPPGKGAIVDPPGGKIPYQPEAAAHAKDLRENHVYEEPEAHCFMSGVPHTAYQQFGFQILQPAGYFLIAYEYAHSFRTVPTDNRPHIAATHKLFMGDSVGRWEGDTLVIDTTNQNGRAWFDMVGNFTTENIHVVERITPVDSNNINYEATIDDPTIYTRPWKIAGTWGRRLDPPYEQFEFACIEGNDDLQHYTEKVGGTAKGK